MYQALYRKYRPKTLDDICGQETIVKIIRNSIIKKQINHAYLFAGPRGTGKTSIAKIFAKIVNCENLKDCTPCEKCNSCTQSNNSDIIEIDAASNNGVDEIRELRNKVNLVPSYGKYKVYIIDEVHMLTVGAFNALLKTLEEPPGHVIFILATTDPQKIPETILSRCQRFDFKKISDKAIVENLKKISSKEKIEIEEEALFEIARISDGGMRDSVGMLDQAKSYTDSKITLQDIHDINGTLTENDLKDLLVYIEGGNLEEILKNTDIYNEKGKNFSKLTEEFINFIRNTLLYKKVPNYFKKIHQNIDAYEEICGKLDENTLFHYIEILNKYSNEMKITTNTKLMFELAFIEMINLKEKPNNKSNDIKTKLEKKPDNVEKISKETIEKLKIKNKQHEQKNAKTTETDTKEKQSTKPDEKNAKEKQIEEFINYIKKIRIDNTLSKFNKKKMLEIKTQLEDRLNELLLNPDYSQAASILLDGTLKAASDDNIIFVYKTTAIATSFNEKLIQIENTIEEALGKKYALIATDEADWEIIKNEFNHKKRQFIYKNEDFNIEEVFKEDNDDIITMFEDIIEYN
ncbi:MAG: DNA polymerase III subunit gamma/tau [Bacilli bacterium]|nr:DNA polymerase III subunit gamma/tau [Bacilli bacterium]